MVSTTEKKGLALKAKLFRGFSAPSRLSILEALRNGPRSVGDIVQATGLSQPNTSNHLACLRDCGLVEAEQDGRYTLYRLSDNRVGDLLKLGDVLLSDVARGVYECVHYADPLTDNSTQGEEHGS